MMTKRARTDGESSRPGAINVQDARFTRCGWRKKRRLSKFGRLSKIVNSGVNPYQLRCWGLNEYANPNGGYFRLANMNQTLATDLGHYLPIWYFDVTAAMNWATPGGSTGLFFGQVSYRPFIRTDTAQANSSGAITFRKNVTPFENNAGNPNGGNVNSISYTGQVVSSTQNGFLKAALHKYMAARMLCYGIIGVPVRFRVSLIRFKKAHLTPGWQDQFFNDGGGAASNVSAVYDQNVAESVALQQYLAGPFRHSPLNVQQTSARKKYQEVVIKDFVLGGAPTGSTVPYMHQLDIFRQFNRVRRYDWQQQVAQADDNQWNNNIYAIQATMNQPNVDFTSRWYLTIRAQALPSTQATAVDPVPDTTKTPSFDFNMMNMYEDII